MAKIKAVLDQETWVEIDVPEEFQSIIKLLFSSDALHSENGSEDVNSTSYNDVLPMADSGQSNAEQPVEQANSHESSTDSTALDRSKPLADSVERNTAHSKISSAQSNNTDKDHKKSASQALFYKGVGYHMVNWLVVFIQHLFYFSVMCTFCSLCFRFCCSLKINLCRYT